MAIKDVLLTLAWPHGRRFLRRVTDSQEFHAGGTVGKLKPDLRAGPVDGLVSR